MKVKKEMIRKSKEEKQKYIGVVGRKKMEPESNEE